jgi:carbamoyltransferase
MGKCRTVLGVNFAYHESSAAILRDGKLLAAAEEERFNRIKHAKKADIARAGELPEKAIGYCLQQAGNPDAVALSFNPKKRLRNIGIDEHPEEGGWGTEEGERRFHKALLEAGERLRERFGLGEDGIHWVDHHLCHAASAYFASSFGDASILAIDGIGEFATTWLGYGEGNRIHTFAEIEYPNSLGFLWEKLSKFLGFTEYDSCKVMGLAGYGDPGRFRKEFDALVRLTEDGFEMEPKLLRFRTEDYRPLESMFAIPRREAELMPVHADIAAAMQQKTNEVIAHLVKLLMRKRQGRNLCLAGGVALNCVSNAHIQKELAGQGARLFIQPAAHDAGTSLGAALYLWHPVLGNRRTQQLGDAYLGPEYQEDGIREALEAEGLAYTHCRDIEGQVASLIAEGRIVAWFQGRLEFGPRALGNRSILADPRNPSVRKVLNSKVKYRERFRPLAPSVLAEKAGEWFEPPFDEPSKYMLVAHKVRREKQGLIPAVVHVDGTSRIHIVDKESNPRYHRLIWEFYTISGVPMVLNTSFNIQEPIVRSPAEAIATFRRSNIDFLAMGNYLVHIGDPHG